MGRVRYDFSGESVLVTGASRGIGRAVAEAFALAGADLTVLSSGAGIHEAAREISARSGRPVRAWRPVIRPSRGPGPSLGPM